MENELEKETAENQPRKERRNSAGASLFSRMGNLSFRSLALLILLLGVSLRVARFFLVDRITKDGVLYVQMANDYDQGPRDKAFKRNRRMPPLYLELISLTHRATGLSYEAAAQAITLVSGILVLIPFLLTARMLFGDRLALVATLLAAAHPSLVRSSISVMRDPLFIFLLITAVFFMVGASRVKGLASYWRWLSGGVFAAFAAATRGEGAELLPAFILWIIIELIIAYRKKLPIGGVLKTRAANFAVFTLAFILTTSAMVASVKDTDSTWGGIDSRFTSYLRGLIIRDSEEIIKEEDTL